MNDARKSERSAIRSTQSLGRSTHLLGWDAPFLPRVVAWLVANQADEVTKRTAVSASSALDMSSDVCVLPTSRGASRLRELLRRHAELRRLEVRLPELITVGDLPERLYGPARKTALQFEQTLAWAHVLRDTSQEQLKPLVPTAPMGSSLAGWLELAATIRRLHEDLSANMLSFANVVSASETDAEKKRWTVLQQLRVRYLARLADAGLSDPHTSRRDAIDAGECRCDHRLLLVGTSDLSKTLSSMLDAVDGEVVTLIAAPESAANCFEDFGSVRTDVWLNHELPIRDEQLVAADDVHDQSLAASEAVAEFGKTHRIGEITIGVTDESHVVPVETQMRSCDVATYRHLGWNVSETAVGRLLRLASAFLEQRTWRSFAALVRHGDVCRMIDDDWKLANPDKPIDALTEVDQFMSQQFPVGINDDFPDQATKQFAKAFTIRDCVMDWLSVFEQSEQPMATWSQTVESWLDQTYATLHGAESNSGKQPLWVRSSIGRDRTRRALVQTKNLLRRFGDLNADLDVELSGSQALEMISQRVADLRVHDEPVGRHVKVLGWLDLPLDDSPSAVVVGLNHPFVPQAITSDPFLPGTLRSQLRMSDNDRRYARDCYAMHLMITSRPDVRFIVGRRGADASPTPPSRLLAAADPADVSRRVGALLEDVARPTRIKTRWDVGPKTTDIPVPSLGKTRPVTTMSVTAFKEYLTCPYRFYLRRILKASPLDDQAHELAANQFGDLVHDTLEVFGKSDDRHETNTERIEAALVGRLHEYADQRYGRQCSAAVRMQVLQAEQRLRAVAVEQARWRELGWRLVHAEQKIDEKTGGEIIVDDKAMGIRGRFDRIDQNERTGEWAILDYKTHGKPPEKKHLKTKDGTQHWVDLQLPLYRLLVSALGIDAVPADVQLGYFNISDKEAETKVNIAMFTESQMSEATELIHNCIRRIRKGDFSPTTDVVEFDDYPMVLQTGIASQMLGYETTDVMEAAL